MRNIIIFFCMCFGLNAYSNQTKDDFVKYQSVVKSLAGKTLNEMTNFKPSEHIKGFKEHADEEKLFGGVEATTDTLKEKAILGLANDKAGSAAYNAISTRPRITINKNSDAIKGAILIQDESTNIVNGRSNDKVDCDNKSIQCDVTYQNESCVLSPSSNGCQSKIDKGCSQISSLCSEYLDGQCVSHKELYSCPSKQCPAPVVCTKDVYCADGNCVDKKPTQSKNFKENLSKLSAASQGADDFKKIATVFAGTVKKCIKRAIGYLDCCEDKGWGKDLNIAQCPDQEKELGVAKQKYLAHFLGDYCSDWTSFPWGGGMCNERSNVYCVFPSKMARIIHQHGRLAHNRYALGDAEHPSCKGLTPQQLSKINMTKIDFIKPVYHWSKEGQPISAPDEKAGIGADINIDEKDKPKAIDDIADQVKNYPGVKS